MNRILNSSALALGVSLFALSSAFSAAVAQESVTARDGAAATRLTADTIIVTGTRNEARTAFDSLAPIDVIGDDALDITASDELTDSLAQLVPSFNVQRLPLNDGLIFVRPARLRNLSPDQTLVLVNGKRRHRSALLGSDGAQAPDLAQIPSYAIKRIEVLRDGASAQYGSDAIAGVINIILDDEAALKAFGQYGEYYEGDGDSYRAGFQAGVASEAGYASFTFEYGDQKRTSRSRQRPDALTFIAANPDIPVLNPVQNWGQPEREIYRFAINSAYNVGAGELYAFGTYGFGDGLSDFNWRNPVSTSAYNPSAAFPDFDLADTFPGGFTPQFGQEDEDLSAVGGFRNRDGAFTYDISAGYGRNEIEYILFDTINASLGPASPTSFRPGTLIQRELNINADFSYKADLGVFAEPVNIAFGGERREETYEIKAGDPASFAIGPGAVDGLPSGSNGFPGYSDDQAGEFDQTSYAGYIDVEIPVTERFTLGLAGRYEDFSEFGDDLNGKVSARYDFSEGFAARATVSTGFRAPTPGQLFSERTSQGLDTVTLNIFTAGRFSPQGPIADVINARPDAEIAPLQPEESENYSVGFVWRSGFGVAATVDFYQIDISDRFGTSPTFTPTAAEQAQFTALGVPGGEGITRVNFFQNAFDTRTRGVDVVTTYETAIGPVEALFSAAYNYNETQVTAGDLAANETNRIRFEDFLPKHTASASANFTFGRFDLLGRVRYYGSWTDFSFNAAGDIFQDFGAEVFFDVAATAEVTDFVTFRMGAENVFNNFPDEAEFQANRGLIYSRNAPYDTDGGQYYFRIDVDF